MSRRTYAFILAALLLASHAAIAQFFNPVALFGVGCVPGFLSLDYSNACNFLSYPGMGR